MDVTDLSSATMLVTGGNTGIGLETVVGLAREGAQVVFTSRDEQRGAAALADACARSGSERIEVMPLDLGSLASVRSFAEQFLARYDRVDVLVNNAGLAASGGRRETADGFEAVFGVNHLGHMELTGLLLDRLVASAPSRVVVVSSGAYRVAKEGLCFDDLQHTRDFHGMQVYAESKLANIYFALELARRLDGRGVTVTVLNPGYVRTELGRPRPGDDAPPPPTSSDSSAARDLIAGMEPVAPDIGARTSILLATSPDLEGVTGAWYSAGRPEELRPPATDEAAARRLWDESERLLATARDRRTTGERDG